MSVRDVSTRTAAPAIQEMPRPAWQGVNHLALVTPDMDATVRFYHGVLGMRVVAGISAGPMRHYFFEWTGGGTYCKPAGWRVEQPLQFDHLSFNLPDHESLVALQARLQEAEVEVTEEIDHGFIHSIYFTASFWLSDATAKAEGDRSAFSDPDPVAAVRELEAAGRLGWMPATDLVPEPHGIA
ncbi:MAG: VOC family protein [Chloroflexi bacterium]|nr:MAG: VOC family protein [Chloroflexota bacterium]